LDKVWPRSIHYPTVRPVSYINGEHLIFCLFVCLFVEMIDNCFAVVVKKRREKREAKQYTEKRNKTKQEEEKELSFAFFFFSPPFLFWFFFFFKLSCLFISVDLSPHQKQVQEEGNDFIYFWIELKPFAVKKKKKREINLFKLNLVVVVRSWFVVFARYHKPGYSPPFPRSEIGRG